MSRHRMKAIALDEDELDDGYDEYEEEEDQLSAEDKEQLRVGTVAVRTALEPDVVLSDAEIQEALWHYYYDIDKSVNYLRGKAQKRKPAAPAAASVKDNKSELPSFFLHHHRHLPFYWRRPEAHHNVVQAAGLKDSLPPPTPTRSRSCSLGTSQALPPPPTCIAPVSAAGFFDDCPWFQIPLDRQADLILEPLYPRLRGLLGGNPAAAAGKMSKLAALAAARKKKEAEQASSGQTGTGQTSVGTSALDRLNAAGRQTEQRENVAPRSALERLRRGSSQTQSQPGSKPEKERPSPVRKESSTKRAREPESTSSPSIPVTESQAIPNRAVEGVPVAKKQLLNNSEALPIYDLNDIRAEPSAFAQVLVGAGDRFTSFVPPFPLDFEQAFYGRHLDKTKVFDFTEPSPDAVVINAQKGKGAAPKSALKNGDKDQKELSAGVKQLKIEEPVKIKSKNLDVLAEWRKTQRKKAANFVVIGHVDAGKSTLMGRLLFDLKAVDARTMEKYKKEAERIGKGSFAFAWVLDQGSEERARGVTIDIATNKFETESTNFTILDAPGHRDFVPNMIAGASQADFAVLVIDASTGNFESGLVGQTKEHALLVRSMGVQKIIVAVNKLDTVDWSKDRFREIEQQMSSFLTTAGFQQKNIAFIPCSGLKGDNITRRSEEPLVKWYTGPTLIEELEASEPATHAVEKSLQMTVGDVFRGAVQNPLSISGRLEAGSLQAGDQILIMPSGEKAFIKSLQVDLEPADWAVAGQNVVLNLTDIDPIHLKVGDVLCSPSHPIQNVKSFTAKVLSFSHLTPMHVDVHRGRMHVPGRIAKLVATLDKATGEPLKKRPKVVAPQNVARIVVEMDEAVPLNGGRVVLRADGETVAAGLLE